MVTTNQKSVRDTQETERNPNTILHKDIYTECSEPVNVLPYIAKGLHGVLP